MKKLICLLIVFVMVLSMAACSKAQVPAEDHNHTNETTTCPHDPVIDPTDEPTLDNEDTLPVESDDPTQGTIDNMQGNGQQGGQLGGNTGDNKDDGKQDATTPTKPSEDDKNDNTGSGNNGNAGGNTGTGGNTGSGTTGTDVSKLSPGTLTLSQWNSLTAAEKSAFNKAHPVSAMTSTERHNYYWVTRYNCYSCGYAGHACTSQADHNDRVKNLATPCNYCGQTNCVRYLQLKDGFSVNDPTACPSYSVQKDPSKYCQTCGKPKWGTSYVLTEICSKVLADKNCSKCGVFVTANACHTCKQSDIDASNNKE